MPECIKMDSPFPYLLENLESTRKVFLKSHTLFDDNEDSIRSVEEAKKLLQGLGSIYDKLLDCFKSYPSLESLFDTEFINFKALFQRENLIELLFIDDFLISRKQTFPIAINNKVNTELLDGYLQEFEEWIKRKVESHLKAQEAIKEEIVEDKEFAEIECQCTVCLADYRSKVRSQTYFSCREMIDEEVQKFHEGLDSDKPVIDFIDQSANQFFQLQKGLEKKIHSVRHRLRRNSVKRLEEQIKGQLKEKFSYPRELGELYATKIRSYFTALMQEWGYQEDLMTQEEFDRFLRQLYLHLWRNHKYLKREFSKLIRSIVFLKRKDISSNILQEYLGQFWVHSEARKMKRKIIYHMGPTNSGKTYHAIEKLAQAKKGCYLAPLRLLAGELFDTLNSKGVVTTLLTGEEIVEKEGATHYSSTVEMAKLHDTFECCVIDEIQMIADPHRGWAWTRALVGINAPEIHICGDETAYDLLVQIAKLTGDELEVKNYERMTKLQVEKYPIELKDLQKGDAVIVFSRRNALNFKGLAEKLGFRVSIVYGRLSPEVRREQARKFDQGETDVIVSTDAISMGMNLPIRRIVFSTLSKFINSKEHRISDSEVKQIAGRAGRFNRYPKGFTTCLRSVEDGNEKLMDALGSTLEQKDYAMVGPDLEIFTQVNEALFKHDLPLLQLSEFLRLFNTMIFKSPFYCVDLTEMIEVTEMVEEADEHKRGLTEQEIFGFACAPVNLGLIEHVQYFIWMLNNYVAGKEVECEKIDYESDNIDYLETSIKCVELYQWLARHFNNKGFKFETAELHHNKSLAIERLNSLLSERFVKHFFKRRGSSGLLSQEESPHWKRKKKFTGNKKTGGKGKKKRSGGKYRSKHKSRRK